MADPEHLRILKRGVNVWKKWREENPDIKPDLRYAKVVNRYVRAAYIILA